MLPELSNQFSAIGDVPEEGRSCAAGYVFWQQSGSAVSVPCLQARAQLRVGHLAGFPLAPPRRILPMALLKGKFPPLALGSQFLRNAKTHFRQVHSLQEANFLN